MAKPELMGDALHRGKYFNTRIRGGNLAVQNRLPFQGDHAGEAGGWFMLPLRNIQICLNSQRNFVQRSRNPPYFRYSLTLFP
ncbi:hypothetical protein J2X76_001797 [Neorhizobium sp. 2083]|uniref:hypothetical protein n=1 Tax=Neorhizobium sp. 2083 TaxID=2817762 RepID=UPI00285A4095|nr:hypothetical protein [Neorhizobium sp. 2083]MDR6816624.1 hypothetical protein [Neorhizobium sp. 2083]